MKELKCTNCNSNELKLENGIYVCQNCGSKFFPDEDSDKVIDKLENKMVDAWLAEEYADARVLSDRLISTDEHRAYGWAIRGGCIIADGITDDNAERIIVSFEKALKYAKVDEIDDLKKFVGGHISLNGSSIIKHNGSLSDRVNALY